MAVVVAGAIRMVVAADIHITTFAGAEFRAVVTNAIMNGNYIVHATTVQLTGIEGGTLCGLSLENFLLAPQ
eukprot:SAG31_NODE_3857_length_3815_cov_2.961518_1_plen_71_part_00